MLSDAAIFLAAAVVAVPIFKRLGLGSVLGYLAAGILIGPSCFGLITGVDRILELSEFGVVLLLFVIGLELQPNRLWQLRGVVLGMGGGQVVLTTLVIAAIGSIWLPLSTALITGFAFSMSSTAFVLQMLGERNELTTHHGRGAFAILLFQDIAVIPILALLPLLGISGTTHEDTNPLLDFAKALAMLAATIVVGRYALRPVLRLLAASQLPEIFTAAALLLVTGTALAMSAAGLSMSLGAFLAGMLLADSEYRHELQADIEPFKGLLLGLFFIAVGMSAKIGLLLQAPLLILGLTVGLVLIKTAVLYVIGRLKRLAPESARALGVSLSQGGEFAFVLFGVAVSAQLMTSDWRDIFVVVVTLSMIITPPLYVLQARLRKAEEAAVFDEINIPGSEVIIAGFGPFGQIFGRLLQVKKVPYTVLDKDGQTVELVRRFGNRIFFSDAGRLEVLRAAKADSARFFVLAIADLAESLRVAKIVREHFPNLRIFACARDRNHALQLMDLGIKDVIRRSYVSSLEMTGALLKALGNSESVVAADLDRFRRHDEKTLRKQQAVYRDEKKLMQSAKEGAAELEQLFEADLEDQAK